MNISSKHMCQAAAAGWLIAIPAGTCFAAMEAIKSGSPSDYVAVPDFKTLQMRLLLDQALAASGQFGQFAILQDNVHGAAVVGSAQPVPLQIPAGTIPPVPIHLPKPPPPIKGPLPTKYISSCQDIRTPGIYVLTADINAGREPCMTIHNTSNIFLDCNGHQITADGGAAPVLVHNVTGLSINGCTIINQYVDQNGTNTAFGLDIEGGQDLSIIGNNIAGINIDRLKKGLFEDNQILGYYQQYNSNNVTLSHNTVTGFSDEDGAAGIIFYGGSNNQALNNTMDGKWNGIPAPSIDQFKGWDDGILLGNEANDLISGNSIQNIWDAGIEGVGTLKNTVISNNTIRHALGTAIGGWYDIDWVGNQILNNQADDVAQLFTIFYIREYSAPVPPVIHFENNRFVNNVVKGLSGIDFYGDAPRSQITINTADNSKIQVDNNFLQNNQFGQSAPDLTPAAGFIDGGSNRCQTPIAGSPIACHP